MKELGAMRVAGYEGWWEGSDKIAITAVCSRERNPTLAVMDFLW